MASSNSSAVSDEETDGPGRKKNNRFILLFFFFLKTHRFVIYGQYQRCKGKNHGKKNEKYSRYRIRNPDPIKKTRSNVAQEPGTDLPEAPDRASLPDGAEGGASAGSGVGVGVGSDAEAGDDLATPDDDDVDDKGGGAGALRFLTLDEDSEAFELLDT